MTVSALSVSWIALHLWKLRVGSVTNEAFKPVRYQVLTAASMKMAVFWVVAPCSLVDVNHRFRGTYCLYHHGDELQAASTSDTLVNFYQTTRRNNPEDSHLHTRRRENLKSHFIICVHIKWTSRPMKYVNWPRALLLNTECTHEMYTIWL
jgi:hypothetical protein